MTELKNKTSNGIDELLQANLKNEGKPRLYEVGYHLVPTIAEDDVAEEVVKIKDSIAVQEGAITTEEVPQKKELAYRLPHIQSNQRTFFDSSYFGSVRFQMPAEKITEFERELKKNPSVIRFIIIGTVLEKAITARKMPFFSSAKKDLPKTEEAIGDTKSKNKDIVRDKLSEEELDKTIEELIKE